jgi:ribonuclease-3
MQVPERGQRRINLINFIKSKEDNLYAALEGAIGYQFGNRELLFEALTHKSFVNEAEDKRGKDNQRLEFFGDSVIGLFVSAELLQRFPDVAEGKLSKIRASLVDEETLAGLARRVLLGRYLRLGRGEEKTGGREKQSVLADAYEALVAAVYLDGGLHAAQGMVERDFRPLLDESTERVSGKDYKTRFQELVQGLSGVPPRYILEDTSGPPHERLFTVSAFVGDDCMGRGEGKSKKEAEQAAAREGLAKLRVESPSRVS